MKKRNIYIIIGAIVLLIGVVILLFVFNRETDGKKFKKEYSYLDISNNNPFIYKSASEIVEMINNKETFAVYFGYANDENVKKVLPEMIKAIYDEKQDKVYYVDIENIRNELRLVDGKIETTKMGTASYYELLNILNDLLDDYDIDSDSKNKVDAGKRITAPTLLAVYNGVPVKLSTGDKDPYNDFKEVLEILKPSNTCNNDAAC